MTEPDRQYIAVDEDEVLRCNWCGTSESSSWIREEGGPWCSYQCHSADRYNRNLCALIALPLLFLVIWVSAVPPMEAIPALGLMTLFMLPILVCCPATCIIPGVLSGRKARQAVPRNSRWEGRSIGQEIHACDQCGGPLDTPGDKSLVTCPYCGFINEAVVSDDDSAD